MADYEPDQSFGFNLHDAARLLRRDFERRAKKAGVTRAQWSALVYLAGKPGITQRELADLLEVTPIAVARLVDRMEDEGLVERRPDPDDRRAWRLHLTARASGCMDTMREHGRATRAIALEGFTDDEQAFLLAALRRVRANLAGGERRGR